MQYRGVSPTFMKAISEAHRFVKSYQREREAGAPGGDTPGQGGQNPTPPFPLPGPGLPGGLPPQQAAPVMALYAEIALKLQQLERMLAALPPSGQAPGASGEVPTNAFQPPLAPGASPNAPASRYASGNRAADMLLDKLAATAAERVQDGDRDAYHFSDADCQAFRDGLASGAFSPRQLTRALQLFLQRVEPRALDEFAGLAARLVREGLLDGREFLSESALRRLSPERRQALALAFGNGGGVYGNGAPNLPFSGAVLSGLGRDDRPLVQAFLRQMLARLDAFAQAHPELPEAAQIRALLQLAGGLEP